MQAKMPTGSFSSAVTENATLLPARYATAGRKTGMDDYKIPQIYIIQIMTMIYALYGMAYM